MVGDDILICTNILGNCPNEKLRACYFSDKGLVSIQGKSHQVIVQGVHELYDLEETAVAWKEDEKRTNRLVLIGRNLDKDIIKEIFIGTVTEKATEEQQNNHQVE
uniref:CobW C-terminal domain-containing protein n=1 Tax=Meleagris gallopavo TaxID=9103 RepID=A0A803XW71_MELGA